VLLLLNYIGLHPSYEEGTRRREIAAGCLPRECSPWCASVAPSEQRAAITSLHDDLKSMKTDINDGMKAIAGDLQESRNHRSDQEVQLEGLLEMGQQVLLTGKPIANNNNINCMTPQQRPPLTSQAHLSSSPMLTPMKSPMDIANFVSQDASEQQEHTTYRMKLKHKSLVDLLSEWIGVGDYERMNMEESKDETRNGVPIGANTLSRTPTHERKEL
jgi:hypothetical protein